MAALQTIQISPAAGGRALTPEQKHFNSLIRKIEQARSSLAAWKEAIPRHAQAYAEQIVPLLEAFDTARRERAHTLDALLNEPGWSKIDQTTLRDLICESAEMLLLSAEAPDADMKALYDKHAEVDFDTEQARSRADLQEMVEDMTGFDLGDAAEIDSDEALFERMQQQWAAAAEAAEAPRAGEPPPRRRKPSAAEQRREAEAQLATQSVREVFRKLASTLHPDRETDPDKRVAKTALMQQANQAYAANDLLTLLELQLQIEQVDAAHIAGASPQRIKHYNKVLAEQLAELNQETMMVEDAFRMDFGFEPGFGLNPAKLDTALRADANELRAELAHFGRQARLLETRAATKLWLKRERQRLREAHRYDGLF